LLARPYRSSDARGLDAIFQQAHPGQGITDLDIDRIFVTGACPTGVLVYRSGAFVHELECGRDAQRRLRAASLSNFAIAHAKANGINSAIFLIRAGNEAMTRFVESLGAVKQSDPGDTLYILAL